MPQGTSPGPPPTHAAPRRCPGCAAPYDGDDAGFCTECGLALTGGTQGPVEEASPSSPTCPRCGAQQSGPAADACRQCSKPLVADARPIDVPTTPGQPTGPRQVVGGDSISVDRSHTTVHVTGASPPSGEHGVGEVTGRSIQSGGDMTLIDRSRTEINITQGAHRAKYSIGAHYPRSSDALPAYQTYASGEEQYVLKRLPPGFTAAQSDRLNTYLRGNGLIDRRQGITAYMEAEQLDGRYYLVRESVQFACLLDVLDHAPFRDTLVSSIVLRICEYMEGQPPHGAIHPGNIFLELDSVSGSTAQMRSVRLTDYFIDEIKGFLALSSAEFASMIGDGSTLNPDYVPDSDGARDRRKRDAFGLAAVAFELLTGRPTDFPGFDLRGESFPEYSERFGQRPAFRLARGLHAVAFGECRSLPELRRLISGRARGSRLRARLFS